MDLPIPGGMSVRRFVALVLLGLSMGALLGCQPERLRTPVYGSDVGTPGTRNFPDPALVDGGDHYYAYSSNSTGNNARNIGLLRSADLFTWAAPNGSAAPAEAMPTVPSWARSRSQGGGFWAPSVIQAGGRWVLYFGARHKNVSATAPGWCIGHATSSSPAGPFTPSAQPLFCRVTSTGSVSSLSGSPATHRGSIDPHAYRAPNGNLFLYFKALDHPYQLWGVRLAADGRSTVGSARGLVRLGAKDRTWEYSSRLGFTVLENPAMDYNRQAPDKPYYLYYSGGEWRSPDYATGVAVCDGPLGPCLRVTIGDAWMASRGGAVGPGGFTVLKDDQRRRWAAYHSWERGEVATGNGRRLHVEPLTYDGLAPVLRNRSPRGGFNADATGVLKVRLHGRAWDPDTAAPVTVVLKRNGEVIDTLSVSGRDYDVTVDAPLGTHRYCAVFKDDNRQASTRPPCEDVETLGGTPG